MDKATEYPLYWPAGWPRTKNRKSGKFRSTLTSALNNLRSELVRFGKASGKPVSNVVISSNVTLGNERPADPGIACYFRWDDRDCCVAVDLYGSVAENLQAIYLVLDAERTKLRHGGLNIVRAAFRGYTALPPPRDANGSLSAPWWEVLGYKSGNGVSLQDAESKYRDLAKSAHPDAGGTAGDFQTLAEAIREARMVLTDRS